MNICLIIASYWPGWGGAEQQCRLLAKEFLRRGHEVLVLTRGRKDVSAEELLEGGAVRRTPALGPGHLQSVVWILTATAWLRRHGRRFDILQGYQLLSPATVGILGRSGRQAVVLRPACSGPYGDIAEIQRLPLTGLRRRLLQRADTFVTLTPAIETELAEFGLGMIPCHRIPNGVDLTAFAPATGNERRALRARLGLPENQAVCAFVGRLSPQKDPALLLEAWAIGHWPQAHLVLVGDGPLRTRLEASVTSGPTRGQVTFAGATADVASYLKAADLLVLPSRAEGMSNTILEAMACGLPIVATDLIGNREVMGDDGQVGRLVPPGDPAALAEAIGTLLRTATLRDKLGEAARAMVAERFDMQRVVTQYVSLYTMLHS
ncbi:MAG: glycosyltransferase family 4 protein [Candidatus Methylomirabilales bacterium]